MEGYERQRLGSSIEADGVGRPCELAIETRGRYVGLLFDRDDELAREPRWLQAPRVEDKDEPLAVAGPAACDVGGDEAPRVPENLEDKTKGTEVFACFFDRNHVETGDDLGDAAKIEEISSGRVVLLRAPLLGHPAESAKVPGCDEEVAVEMPGRDRFVQSDDESSEDFGEVLRERIGDLGRDPQS